MGFVEYERLFRERASGVLQEFLPRIVEVGLRVDVSWDRHLEPTGPVALEIVIHLLDSTDDIVDIVETEVMRNGEFIATPDELADWLRSEIGTIVKREYCKAHPG